MEVAMTRTSKLAALLIAFFIGVVGTPEKFKFRTSARAFVTTACQQELDDLNAANAALTAAEDDLADALADEQVAQQAYYLCEMTTPGACQAEAADLTTASAGVTAAQQDVATAAADQLTASYAYYNCLYGY